MEDALTKFSKAVKSHENSASPMAATCDARQCARARRTAARHRRGALNSVHGLLDPLSHTNVLQLTPQLSCSPDFPEPFLPRHLVRARRGATGILEQGKPGFPYVSSQFNTSKVYLPTEITLCASEQAFRLLSDSDNDRQMVVPSSPTLSEQEQLSSLQSPN
ncbi:hypothetical protein J6590_025259 [Homalodisca vitripennis]|nr:hypothetical protein J6590_025259 [Homalodisca vitripennis]